MIEAVFFGLYCLSINQITGVGPSLHDRTLPNNVDILGLRPGETPDIVVRLLIYNYNICLDTQRYSIVVWLVMYCHIYRNMFCHTNVAHLVIQLDCVLLLNCSCYIIVI